MLHGIRGEVAEDDALYVAHGAPFYPPAAVRTATIAEMRECAALVVTAGRGGRPHERRFDVLRDNAAVVRDAGTQLKDFEGVIVTLMNPVDVLTSVMTEVSGLPPSRVIGSGTMLDTACYAKSSA